MMIQNRKFAFSKQMFAHKKLIESKLNFISGRGILQCTVLQCSIVLNLYHIKRKKIHSIGWRKRK